MNKNSFCIFGQSKFLASDFEPPPWRKNSARKRAKNSEFVGGIRRGAHDYISHHHILGACEVIISLCFENRFGLGTIDTLILNLKKFLIV